MVPSNILLKKELELIKEETRLEHHAVQESTEV
jgi:hypothetical protein